MIGFFPETSTRMDTFTTLLEFFDTHEIGTKIPRLIFYPNPLDRDYQTKDYNYLIDFCTPPAPPFSSYVFDKSSFSKLLLNPFVQGPWIRPIMKTLNFSIVKVETFSDDKPKRLVYLEFGFICDISNTFLDHLKQKTKKKHCHFIFTEEDNNYFNYFFYNTPVYPFRIEVWGKKKLLAENTFPSIEEFLNLGTNLSNTFEFNTTKQKLKCQVRVQWLYM